METKILDPKAASNEPTMDLHAKKGHKVKVTEETIKNGYGPDKHRAARFLKVGGVYTVEEMKVYDWSSALILQEIPGQEFNTVHFIDA